MRLAYSFNGNRPQSSGRGHALLIVIVAFAIGCGASKPDLVNVAGRVTLDGQSLAQAMVTFVPSAGGRPGRGETDADGRFRLTTFDDRPNEGVYAGEYAVTVVKVEAGSNDVPRGEDGLPQAGSRPTLKWLIPERYGNAATSSISQAVPESGLECVIELSSSP